MFLQIAACAALIKIMHNPDKYDKFAGKSETVYGNGANTFFRKRPFCHLETGWAGVPQLTRYTLMVLSFRLEK